MLYRVQTERLLTKQLGKRITSVTEKRSSNPTKNVGSFQRLEHKKTYLKDGAIVTKKAVINFEKTFMELEKLVNQMEQGDLSLEESLKYFERGMLLTKKCQQALSEAEQKVKILLEKNNKNSLETFDLNNKD